MNRNEALILNKRPDIMSEVTLSIEAFTDDILETLDCKDFYISYEVADNQLTIRWRWDAIEKSTDAVTVFTYNVVDTSADFIHRVKSYLFDLTIMIINLR